MAAAWAKMAAAELAESLHEIRDRWDELEPSLQDQLRFGEQVSAGDYIAAARRRHQVTARFDELLGADSVLVVPTVNRRAGRRTGRCQPAPARWSAMQRSR